MLKKRRLRLPLSLMLLVMSLSGCSTPAYYSSCPVYPAGGEKVGKELATIPYEGYQATWEWLGRIDKLRQELELCK